MPIKSWIVGLAVLAGLIAATGTASADAEEEKIALSLADLLRSARTVISSNQDLINDPSIGDKGLSGDVVVAQTLELYQKNTGMDPMQMDGASRQGRFLRAQLAAIKEVMDENQATVNQPGVDFKGFVPAVFARLVNERFGEIMGQEAEVKVTAPLELVRNRKSRPDKLEADTIRTRFLAPDWPNGQILAVDAPKGGRDAFRVLVPEYYGQGCLTCHGMPKGEVDITGYPKEGGQLGDLGGVISITLYR